jgi:hypothetical protein
MGRVTDLSKNRKVKTMATATKKLTDKGMGLQTLCDQIQALEFPTEDIHSLTDKAGVSSPRFSDGRVSKIQAQWQKGKERALKVFTAALK